MIISLIKDSFLSKTLSSPHASNDFSDKNRKHDH